MKMPPRRATGDARHALLSWLAQLRVFDCPGSCRLFSSWPVSNDDAELSLLSTANHPNFRLIARAQLGKRFLDSREVAGHLALKIDEHITQHHSRFVSRTISLYLRHQQSGGGFRFQLATYVVRDRNPLHR